MTIIEDLITVAIEAIDTEIARARLKQPSDAEYACMRQACAKEIARLLVLTRSPIETTRSELARAVPAIVHSVLGPARFTLN